MKKLSLLCLCVFLTGCNPPTPIRFAETANSGVKATVLAHVDGKYTVYRVELGDVNTIYFVAREENITTSYEQNCGEDCTETIHVQTVD